MACCKSDYSLYHRTMAGWLRAEERLVLGAPPARPGATPRSATTMDLTLWPFDRRAHCLFAAVPAVAMQTCHHADLPCSRWCRTGDSSSLCHAVPVGISPSAVGSASQQCLCPSLCAQV